MINLVQIHIGKQLPNYLFDNIYQTLLLNNYPEFTLYMLIEPETVDTFNKILNTLNIDTSNVKCISINSTNEKIELYKSFIKKFNLPVFRDNFWTSTTTRFFYMEEFMRLYNIENMFHIENDIMIYEDFRQLQLDSLYMVQDNPERVIPSIIYFPNLQSFELLNNYILNELKNTRVFLNDMVLLGKYPSKKTFNIFIDNQSKYIFDGAAIGQFLGGVDPKNLPLARNETLKRINNPSKGFINESCVFKITDDMTFFRKKVYISNRKQPLDLIYCTKPKQDSGSDQHNYLKQVFNIHVHSKELYQFSSIFDMKYNHIITGDRIVSFCDLVLTTPSIFNYHKNVSSENMILVNDFSNIDINNLNEIIRNLGKDTIKLFVYTHTLELFVKHILFKLYNKVKYIIYLHNSDHSLENDINYNKLSDCKLIKHVYAQNINCELNPKFSLLPIGLANSMFKHGNKISLYTVMADTFNKKKTNNIYININPNTFHYRRTFLSKLQEQDQQPNLPFKDYLYKLSSHYFCLCIRGNGQATHREFEALYLNVVPIFINNKYTKMDNYIQYFKQLDLPFYEIKDDSIDTIIEKYFKTDFFNKELYDTFDFTNTDSLKIDNYF